jgi:hypothetical protein
LASLPSPSRSPIGQVRVRERLSPHDINICGGSVVAQSADINICGGSFPHPRPMGLPPSRVPTKSKVAQSARYWYLRWLSFPCPRCPMGRQPGRAPASPPKNVKVPGWLSPQKLISAVRMVAQYQVAPTPAARPPVVMEGSSTWLRDPLRVP